MTKGMPLVVIALASAPAFGCGYCDEDKIAVVYDHGLVAKTLAHGHDVAFIAYELRAPIGGESSDAIRRALEGIAGIDRGSVRVASESFSLAFDPRRLPPRKLLIALDRELGPLGVRATLLRIGNPASDVDTPRVARALSPR
jgi:hypothetical protein